MKKRLLPDLSPGFLVLLEGIDFHPTLEDRHCLDAVAPVNQLLKQIRDGGLGETCGFVEAGRLVFFLRGSITLAKGLRAFLGEHGYADEFPMGLFPWKLLADLDHPVFAFRHHEPRQVTLARRFGE